MLPHRLLDDVCAWAGGIGATALAAFATVAAEGEADPVIKIVSQVGSVGLSAFLVIYFVTKYLPHSEGRFDRLQELRSADAKALADALDKQADALDNQAAAILALQRSIDDRKCNYK